MGAISVQLLHLSCVMHDCLSEAAFAASSHFMLITGFYLHTFLNTKGPLPSLIQLENKPTL